MNEIHCLQYWTTSFLNLARTYIPNRTILIRTKDQPWFNSTLRKLKKQKDKEELGKKLKSEKPDKSFEFVFEMKQS